MNKKLLKILFLAFLVCVSRVALPGENDAVKLVEGFHETLLDVMKNADSLGYQGRFDRLAPSFNEKFDIPLISQVILSRYWNELSPEQQQNFIHLFMKLSISTYASRFDKYDGEEFKTTGVEELKKGRLLVRTEFIRKNEESVKFDYLLHQKDGNWYIISVIANGVNDLSVKRSEYGTIINDRGFDSLVGEIERKIEELSSTTNSG